MATIKTLNGVTTSHVKTLNGVAISHVKTFNGLSRPSSVTYATWNPSDKSANITLSNGNLTATNIAASWNSVRATIGKSSGKRYWEINVGSTSEGMTGIGTSSTTLSSYPGADANGYSYYSTNGSKVNNGNANVYGNTYTNGDVIGVALDMDTGTIKFYKNNTVQNAGTAAFTGLSGTFYPMQGLNIASNVITANFGATTMSYTAPSGYNQGLYS